MRGRLRGRFGILRGRRGKTVGLVKTRRLAAMQKQQRAKAGMKPPMKKGACALSPHFCCKSGGRPAADLPRRDNGRVWP